VEQLIERPSVVRSAELEGRRLRLTIQLYDLIAPPPMPEPVLELTLHDCASGAERAAEALRDSTVWEIEQDESAGALQLTFYHDMGEIARVECSRLSSERRAFEGADWLALVESYDRWMRREQAEGRRLTAAIRDVERALDQRLDRARRILDQSGGHAERSAQATGRLKALEEIANVLRTSLAKDA